MIADLLARRWDVIVIGAGLGGGLVGRRLAEAKLRVLFLEAGSGDRRGDDRPWTDLTDPVERYERGYWPLPIEAMVDARRVELLPMLGTGIGGTSAFYAAMLERPERHDLDELPETRHPTGGWPVGFDGFAPHFVAAEALLAVCGESDPLSREARPALRTAPPMSEGDAMMVAAFRRAGLHPYRKHVGVRYLPGCTECFGRKCARACKMDGRSAGVEPALATGNAAVLDRTTVTALRGGPGGVAHVEAVRDGVRLTLEARTFVLAAGALSSPRLLLASAAEHWPQGCANASGLVGRNLMFHLNETIAIWPERRADFRGPVNTISMRDYYHRDGTRFGHVQSLGLNASYGQILARLRERFDGGAPRAARGLRPLVRVPALIAAIALGEARVFKGLLEDLPYEVNRVELDPAEIGRIRFRYTIMPELAERRRRFRALIKAGLGGRWSFFTHGEPEFDVPHACGTLRFGHDPRRSVLDPDCRAHGIANLYVVDASFMPTSTGVNPSLTIAANALRVAGRIIAACPRADKT